jgi:hypothetical protein
VKILSLPRPGPEKTEEERLAELRALINKYRGLLAYGRPPADPLGD